MKWALIQIARSLGGLGQECKIEWQKNDKNVKEIYIYLEGNFL